MLALKLIEDQANFGLTRHRRNGHVSEMTRVGTVSQFPAFQISVNITHLCKHHGSVGVEPRRLESAPMRGRGCVFP